MTSQAAPGVARRTARFCGALGRVSWAALLGALGFACNAPGVVSEPRVLGEFGIFYGGQVQEREELALEIDRARQLQGFRLQLDPAPQRPLDVRWELGMPGVGRALPDSQGRRLRSRKVQLGQARWRPGESTFEQVLPFAAGDPLGLWNMRVLVERRVVIDRAFLVYDATERARRHREQAERDAGF